MIRGRAFRSSGFTLIEVLLSLVILVGITTITWRSLSGIMRTRQLLDDQRLMDATANSLILRLTRELQLADDSRTLVKSAAENDPALAGKKLYGTRREMHRGRPADGIVFMARNGAQYVAGSEVSAGIVQISYRVAEDPEQPDSLESTYYLIRDETPDVRPVEKALQRTITFPITNRLLSLSFRYHEAEEDQWLESWDAEGLTSLPSMIEFTFELKSPLGRTSRYATAVPLRSSPAGP